jgi:hypothetical protein
VFSACICGARPLSGRDGFGVARGRFFDDRRGVFDDRRGVRRGECIEEIYLTTPRQPGTGFFSRIGVTGESAIAVRDTFVAAITDFVVENVPCDQAIRF